MTVRPKKITLRYYNVGFGDCLLLVFHYASEERFVLIDCGTTSAPGTADGGELLLKVALDVEKRCNQKLHAVIATHRHKDHIEGFRRKTNGKGAGDVFLRCRPDAVLLPWTEDPDLETDATRPTTSLRPAHAAVRGLLGMQAASAGLLAEARRLAPSLSGALAKRLAFMGEDNLGNRNALETLWEMGKQSPAKRCHFLHYGAKTGLESVLPGVRVKVLGPPTIEQHAAVLKQRQSDDAEYWHLLGLAGRRASRARPQPFPRAALVGRADPQHRWIRRRLQRLRGEQLYEVVRTVDDALNNTSLILLFKIGSTTLLFPGDAQIENWEYALAKNKQDLAGVRLYKVGHHGSLNATPKSLWNGFTKKSGASGGTGALISLCSTKSGVHGQANEVPRKKLVDELKKHSEYRETPELSKQKKLWGEIELAI